MDELGLVERQSSGHHAKVNRPLAELHFLVMQAERKKERRRLVIATLEALVASSLGRSGRRNSASRKLPSPFCNSSTPSVK